MLAGFLICQFFNCCLAFQTALPEIGIKLFPGIMSLGKISGRIQFFKSEGSGWCEAFNCSR
jgi:hypothetical protein